MDEDEARRREIADNVETARKTRAWNVPQLLRETGLARETYYRVRDSKPVRTETYEALQRAFGWTGMQMADRTDPGAGGSTTPLPVGAGVDPSVLADLDEGEVAKVVGFIEGLKASRESS